MGHQDIGSTVAIHVGDVDSDVIRPSRGDLVSRPVGVIAAGVLQPVAVLRDVQIPISVQIAQRGPATTSRSGDDFRPLVRRLLQIHAGSIRAGHHIESTIPVDVSHLDVVGDLPADPMPPPRALSGSCRRSRILEPDQTDSRLRNDGVQIAITVDVARLHVRAEATLRDPMLCPIRPGVPPQPSSLGAPGEDIDETVPVDVRRGLAMRPSRIVTIDHHVPKREVARTLPPGHQGERTRKRRHARDRQGQGAKHNHGIPAHACLRLDLAPDPESFSKLVDGQAEGREGSASPREIA